MVFSSSEKNTCSHVMGNKSASSSAKTSNTNIYLIGKFPGNSSLRTMHDPLLHSISFRSKNLNITDIIPQKGYMMYIEGEYNKIHHCGMYNSKGKLKQVKCFDNAKDLKIKKVCQNWTETNGLFWITVDSKIYYTPFYLSQLSKNLHYPINELSKCRISDIHINGDNVYALRNNSDYLFIIIQRWTKQITINLPNDLFKLIILFYGANYVYKSSFHSPNYDTTRTSNYYKRSADAKPYFIYQDKSWIIMPQFKHKSIIQIASGVNHCLFLDSNGTVYECGDNLYGQIHDTLTKRNMNEPILINKGMKIKSIACGLNHSLAIDAEFSNVYSWGCNKDGQCGVSLKKDKNGLFFLNASFQIIKHFEKYDCDVIECGGYHSFVQTEDNMYFLFGNNKYNQCSLKKDKYEKQMFPLCVNQVIDEIKGDNKLKKISLGKYSAIIFMEGHQ